MSRSDVKVPLLVARILCKHVLVSAFNPLLLHDPMRHRNTFVQDVTRMIIHSYTAAGV